MPEHELSPADKEALLIAEAAALGGHVWEAYMQGWESDVIRRINERFPEAVATGGDSGASGGELPDLADG